MADGLWTALLVGLITAPFAAAFWPLSLKFYSARSVISSSDAFLDRAYALLLATTLLALLWGLAMLLLVPAALACYAASGRPRDLFDPARALRLARERFATWNLAVATIVTAWALGLAAAGLACLGVVPGVFYAILVSAHAISRIDPVQHQTRRQEDDQKGGPQGASGPAPHLPAG